ncbi:MAG: PTS sugar transporter subunit IIC/EAL domain-containing protein [Lachnospiraceae bacterium]|nr:PTS sugar transporter subunit IIC/EAL domain-containing protein [Lachnospiraceae bacterium]
MKKNITKNVSVITRTIKASLAMVIPILFIGSMTVLLNGFPVQVYQDFLDSFMGGALRNIFLFIQMTTVGILAVYLTIAISLCYMNLMEGGERLVFRFGCLLGCLTGFFILVGFFTGDKDFSLLSGQGVFSALLAGIIGSALYRRFVALFDTKKKVFVDGADSVFNASLHIILPFLCVILCFAVANYLITLCFGVESVQHLFMKAMESIFMKMQRSYLSGLLFTILISTMWWFGIHGNNVLYQVSEDMFTAIIPGQIISKSFIDTFVNMGGTGCIIGLLLAMVIFGKRSSTKKLSKIAFIPCIFNISELLVFGFPVIYNPLMIVPFIMAPALCFTTSFLLTKAGFLPYVTNTVVWTTPPLMSGFIATGSVRGIFAQLINIVISAACYAPFLIMYEKRSLDEFSGAMDELVGILKKSEETTEEVILTECEGNVGRLAKLLATDLESSLSSSAPDAVRETAESPLIMKYQPQFDNTGKCIGAEALLRWNHKRFGIIYPPLAVRLAKESGELYRLETYIIEKSIRDSESFRQCFGDSFKLSVNITVSTLYDKRIISFLQTMADRYKLKTGNICIEITEETELVTTEETGELMKKIRMFGYTFALDDFSMGHTSLQYLQHNQFDIVKLDGNLVRGILDNDRTKEIINSIVYLSKSLDFKVLAEFVENTEQRDALEQIGCLLYQGYLFSPAVDRDSLIQMGQPEEN